MGLRHVSAALYLQARTYSSLMTAPWQEALPTTYKFHVWHFELSKEWIISLSETSSFKFSQRNLFGKRDLERVL